MQPYQHFQSDGVDIAYVDSPAAGADGDKTILLIHGFASNISINWGGTGWIDALNGAGFRMTRATCWTT